MLAVALVAWLTLELFSFVAIWALGISKPVLRSNWIERVDEGEGVEAVHGVGNSHVIHPYVGYVLSEQRGVPVPPESLGFADVDVIRKRAPGKTLIGIVGGSVAHHFSWAGYRPLVRLLKESPEFADKDIQVIKLAAGGYKEPQQLMTVNYLLTLGAEFDVIINIDGFNEVALHRGENEKKGVFPIFPRGWYSRTENAVDPATRRRIGEVEYITRQRIELAATYRRIPWKYSQFLTLLWALRDKRLVHQMAVVQAELLHAPAEARRYVSTGPQWEFGSEEELYQHLVDIWKRSSLLLDEVCRGNGIRYYHFLQPNQYFPGTKTLSREEEANAYEPTSDLAVAAERAYPLLEKAGEELRERGVHFTDLTEVFRDQTATIYTDTCCHFNELGIELVAERVAQAVLRD